MRELSIEWDTYIAGLKSSKITLNQTNDQFMWSWNRAVKSVTTDLAYQCFVFTSHSGDLKWRYKPIWKINIPSKVICFMWLCLTDCILTGANYKKRGRIGHVVCSICLQDDETT
jgi:hypothetical protein